MDLQQAFTHVLLQSVVWMEPVYEGSSSRVDRTCLGRQL